MDFIFPPQCVSCGAPGTRLCKECFLKIKRLPGTICPICGEPQDIKKICNFCKKASPSIQAIRSYGYFRDPLSSAIHQIKYHQDLGLAEQMGRLLVDMFYQELKWDVDIVTAIPLSRERYFERGYNQANLIARPFSWAIRKPFIPSIVRRIRNTSSQVGLSRRDRQKNIRDAFQGHSQAFGLRILILDDVTTTGATIMECARALKIHGAKEIFGLTLAKTPSFTNLHTRINENLI